MHARKCIAIPAEGQLSRACHRFSTLALEEVPNSRSCDEFSVEEFQRLQIVLFTLRDPKMNAVYNDTADVQHVPRELGVMAKDWVLPSAEAARDPRAGSHTSRDIFGPPTLSSRSEDTCGQRHRR